MLQECIHPYIVAVESTRHLGLKWCPTIEIIYIHSISMGQTVLMHFLFSAYFTNIYYRPFYFFIKLMWIFVFKNCYQDMVVSNMKRAIAKYSLAYVDNYYSVKGLTLCVI